MKKRTQFVSAVVTGLTLGGFAWPCIAPQAAVKAPPNTVIAEIQYNSPGSDTGSNVSLNKEWVIIRSNRNFPVPMTGKTLRDKQGHVFTFPSFTLAPHGQVKIHTGRGSDTRLNLFWGKRSYIWNNNTDKATLRNAAGTFISSCSYNDPSEHSNDKFC